MTEKYGIPGIARDDSIGGGLNSQQVSGFNSFGRQTSNPQFQWPDVYNPRFNFSTIRSAHSLKFGYEFQAINTQINDLAPVYGRSGYSGKFSSPTPGSCSNLYNLADFFVGAQSSMEMSRFEVLDYRQRMHFFYVQDDWKVSPGLTLNLGVRYEFSTPQWEANNRLGNFNPATGELIVAKDGSLQDRSTIQPDYHNWAPRIGFAYSVTPKTVLRKHRHPPPRDPLPRRPPLPRPHPQNRRRPEPPGVPYLTMRTILPLIRRPLTLLAQPDRTIVQPADNRTSLSNPGMGWGLHHYDNGITRYGVHLDPSDTVNEFPGLTHIYLRLAWSYLEPEEGKFNWSLVDIPAQRWVAKGYQVAFRFSCVETNRDQPYATPEWVRLAGAKGHFFTPGKGIDANGTHWEPDFDDPIFLAKLDDFLAAAAARYDGNPEVAFIDLGSIGAWGEGHTFPTTGLPYSPATVRKHIDLHVKHFKKTLIAVNDDHSHQGRGLETIVYARDHGLGLRDDSILVQPAPRPYHHAYLAPLFFQNAPVILESEHYGPSVKRGAWADGELYLKAVEEYHASYATVHWYPREFLQQCRDLIHRINMRLGYRLQLLEASWPPAVGPGQPFTVGYRWRNAGVAPCLPGGFPAITLKDSKGGIAGLFVDEEFDMRALPVGAPGQAEPVGREVKSLSQASRSLIEFRLPPPTILKPGRYDLYISVGSRTGTPTIALPLDNDDGSRRYFLGQIAVE